MKKLYFTLFLLNTLFINAQVSCGDFPVFNTLPDSICYSNPFDIDASVNGYDNYLWQDGSLSPQYTVTGPGTYYCTVTNNTTNIVVNGDFDNGNLGFTSDYISETGNLDSTPGAGSLQEEGEFAVGLDPHDYHDSWPTGTDHSGGGGMMIVNGASIAGANIWCQTIHVDANTDYVFSTFLTSIYPTNPAQLVFSIDGDTLGNVFEHSGVVGQWNIFFQEWHSDITGTIDICIQNQNTAFQGNDFAIDDIFFGASCTQIDSVTVVEDPVSIFTTNDVCYNEAIQFTNASTTSVGTITSSNWIFGDGSFSNATNPSHLYNGTGPYQAILEVTNSFGCTDTSSAILSSSPITSITTATNALCYGSSDGTTSVIPAGGINPYTYAWDSGATGPNATNLSAGTYNVTITDSRGCTNTNNATVNNPSEILTNVSPIDILCDGDTNGEADLSVSGGVAPYTYLWSNGQTTQDAIYLTNQAYSVTVTDANDCTTSNTTNIASPSPLVASYTKTDLLCFNDDNGDIQMTINGATPPYELNWDIGGTALAITNLYAGEYTLSVTDANNCQIIERVEILQPEKVEIDLPLDFYMCENPEEIIISSATGGIEPYNYQWNTGAFTSDITVSPVSNTIYTISVTDANNCLKFKNIEVNIYPDLEIDVYANIDTVCPSEGIILSAHCYGGSGEPYSLFIDGEPSVSPITVVPINAQTYVLSVVDQCGNMASEAYTLFNYPSPNVAFISDIIQGCQPLTVNFKEHGNGDDCTYLWDFDDINTVNTSTDQEHTHIFEDDGIYDITCQVTNSYGCVEKLIKNQMINVFPKPDAYFIADPVVTSLLKPTIQFFNETEGAELYSWNFDDGYTSLSESPNHRYNTPGVYDVELIATSQHNCKDTTVREIKINNELTFYAPTAFSPDNDGKNDYFKVFGNGINKDDFKLIVYDRWGEPIWDANDIDEGWDGKAKRNDDVVQIGTYTWICFFKDFNNAGHEEAGLVHLIR